MAFDDDDTQDDRSELEKALDKLSGGVRDIFKKATGQEDDGSKPASTQQAQQPQKPQDPKTKAAISAFFMAVRRNDVKEAEKYLREGYDPNAYNVSGETALHVAARQGAHDVAEFLLQNGANPKLQKRNDPALPLDEAVNFGKVELVELLTRYGGYVPGMDQNGRTVLHRATEKGKTRMVEAMIRAGADANERTANGSTPLIIAISLRHTETAEALLNFPEVVRGINDYTNTHDAQQRNAFQLALARGLPTVVARMLDYGADVNAADAEGSTPLRIAILNANEALVKTLVDRGADAGKAQGGRTLPVILAAGTLEIADGRKRAAIVDYLVAKGADPDARQPVTGMTALALAIMVSNGRETVAALLKHGVRLDPVDHEGFTPIYYTLQKPDSQLLQMLIAAGADVNARHHVDARTPLIQAVHDNAIESARLLLEAGANPRLYDSHGRSALSYARNAKNEALVEMLESALVTKKKPAVAGPKP